MLIPVRRIPVAVNRHAKVVVANLPAAALLAAARLAAARLATMLASPVRVVALVVAFTHWWFCQPLSLLNLRELMHLSQRVSGMKFMVPDPSSWADKPFCRPPILSLFAYMSFFQFG